MENSSLKNLRITYVLFILIAVLYFTFHFVIPVMLASTIALSLYPIQLKLELMGWKKKYAASFLTFFFQY